MSSAHPILLASLLPGSWFAPERPEWLLWVLAVTAIAETNQWWWLVYPKYITYEDYGGFILGRGRGPFLNPSACGLVQGTCLCALLMWWPRVGRPGKLVLLAVALVMLAGIYSTLTRSALRMRSTGPCPEAPPL